MKTAVREAYGTTNLARRLFGLLVSVLMLLALPTCEFVDPTAPEGASISISANPTFIDVDGEESAITVIISEANGTNVPDDTVVNFTTTLGTIPARVGTREGVAQVTLTSGGQAGVATVTARSGATDNEVSVEVVVGAILESLTLSANPSALGPGGGSTEVKAIAFGDDGEPLAGVPVTFAADAGALASAGVIQRTDENGETTDTLTTDQTTNVTVTSGSQTANTTVQVSTNQPPQAQFVVSPVSPAVGQRVNFNASGSTDDGSIVSFEWDFGDGASASGRRVSHRYETVDTYTVLLVVTDDEGARSSSSRTVTVSAGRAPVASFVFQPSSPSAGQNVSFNASTSMDPDGEIVEYRWDWGDGSSPEIRSGPNASHTFGTSGNFVVRLTVRDNAGNVATVAQSVQIS